MKRDFSEPDKGERLLGEESREVAEAEALIDEQLASVETIADELGIRLDSKEFEILSGRIWMMTNAWKRLVQKVATSTAAKT